MPSFIIIDNSYIQSINCKYEDLNSNLDNLRLSDNYLVFEDSNKAFGNNLNKNIKIDINTLNLSSIDKVAFQVDPSNNSVFNTDVFLEDRTNLGINLTTNSNSLWKVSGDFYFENVPIGTDGYTYNDGYHGHCEVYDGYDSFSNGTAFSVYYKHNTGSGSFIFEKNNLLEKDKRYILNINFENIRSGNNSDIYIIFGENKIKIDAFLMGGEFQTEILSNGNYNSIGVYAESSSYSFFKITKFITKEIVGKSNINVSGDIVSFGSIKSKMLKSSNLEDFSETPEFYNNLKVVEENNKLTLVDQNENSILYGSDNLLNLENLIMVILSELNRVRNENVSFNYITDKLLATIDNLNYTTTHSFSEGSLNVFFNGLNITEDLDSIGERSFKLDDSYESIIDDSTVIFATYVKL